MSYWAQDGVLDPKRHICGPHHNIFVYENQNDLVAEIVRCFSFDGQTVIDGIANGGM